MKRIHYLTCGAMLLLSVITACSDGLDQLDEINKEIKNGLSAVDGVAMPQIKELYCDAVCFQAEFPYYCSEMHFGSSASDLGYKCSFGGEQFCIDDLTPNTTYYYKVVVDRNDDLGKVESPVQSFMTKILLSRKANINKLYYYYGLEIYIDLPFDRADFWSYENVPNLPITIYYSDNNSSWPTSVLYQGNIKDSGTTKKGLSGWHKYGYGDCYFYDYNFTYTSGKSYSFRVVIDGLSSNVAYLN